MSHVPARDIPIPTSVSPQARAIMTVTRPQMPPDPRVDEIGAWRQQAG
jgi:epsilon-lactone hydrolase